MGTEFKQMRKAALPIFATLGMTSLVPLTATAQEVPISLRDSVPIGSNGLCEAQIQSPQASAGLFDRDYIVVCRDASAAVGSLHVFGEGTIAGALTQLTADGLYCRESQLARMPEGLETAFAYICTTPESQIERLVMIGSNGNHVFAANGLAVYEGALRLGIGSLATDRVVAGTVQVPLTQADNPQAFARAQAETISAEIALNEAYRRSNAGNFAEAAQFFSTSASTLQGANAAEATLNAALQQSNLGNYLEAGLLFSEAQAEAENNPVLARLSRNFQAIDALNRERPQEALVVLDTELPAIVDSLEATLQLQIDNALAERLSAEQGNAVSGAGRALTLAERIQLLDGQGDYLRASAMRLSGQNAGAEAALLSAQADIVSVREGRVVSILWLRAQILAELAEMSETRGDITGAEALHLQAINVIQTTYPGTPALVSARAQYASFLARTGREEDSMALYRDVVANAEGRPPATLRHLLAPYFQMLGERAGEQRAAADMFLASQLLLRPGLAQTQAVLARELSAGNDEASQLFRQSINLSRAVEVLRGNVAQAEVRVEQEVPGADVELANSSERLGLLQQRQLEVQQALAAFPRYRVVSDTRMELADLQNELRDGEAYLKLVMLGDDAYAIYAESDDARAYALDASPDDIATMVDILRDSIAIETAGQTITYPFEIGTARELYSALLGPVSASLTSVDHLVFEPDGAMLRLPANLLVMDDASVETYVARVEDPDADPYDYRGTSWLGRAMQVSTAVSPTSFRDVRNARRSDAQNDYLGLGQNLPLEQAAISSGGTRSGQFSQRCSWVPATWNNPISASELRSASSALQTGGANSLLLTDGDFTDTRLAAMDDLDEYRILHFATHGLVTAPEPGCAPRPALLTSFGDEQSDGLLSFAEIFDLNLDADLVILSACNTASGSGMTVSREAGVSSNGDFALDGLVRAFVGAGGRTVVASHWPVPDDYNATGRLIAGFFDGEAGVGTAEALRRSQLTLMDDADTSHPFYWSAFAVVGDGTIAVRR